MSVEDLTRRTSDRLMSVIGAAANIGTSLVERLLLTPPGLIAASQRTVGETHETLAARTGVEGKSSQGMLQFSAFWFKREESCGD
jgi:hypothetical protein